MTRPCLHLTTDSDLRCPGCGRVFATEREWAAASEGAIDRARIVL